jgi:hypothetical protein
VAWSAVPATALAQWPTGGTPLCVEAGDQSDLQMIPDGVGGAIVAWEDLRSGTSRVYVRRVLATGHLSAGWQSGGTPVGTPEALQETPAISPDGAGGVFVAWRSVLLGQASIRLQHLDPHGSVALGWPSDGLVIYGDPGVSSYEPDVATDDAGGAIVLWYDFRSGSSNPDVRAQRVTPTGALSPGWPAGGVAVTLDLSYQYSPVACADGAHGAWVVWIDARGGGDDIYGQHISDTGTLLPADVPVAVAAGVQGAPAIVADGSGGAIIAWEDARPFLRDIFAQHVLANGNLVWAPGGIALSDASGEQFAVSIAADGAGGAIAAWSDFRGGDGDVYATHVDAQGAPVGGWTVDGSPVCAITGSQRDPRVAGDGAGGAWIAWHDHRSGDDDVYATHWSGAGVPVAGFDATGNLVCGVPGAQNLPRIVPSGPAGVIAAWQDRRGGGTPTDVYAGFTGPPDGTPPTVTLLTPNGGEVWGTGSTHDLTWSASDDVSGVTLDLEYSPDDGATWLLVTDSVPNTGRYAWTLPLQGTSEARARITAIDASGGTTSATSAGTFTLVAPPDSFTISVAAGPGGSVAPTGEVRVESGANQTFTITPAVGHVIVDVMVDGASVGPVPSYTFSAVLADHVLEATFGVAMHAVAAVAVGPGAARVEPSQSSYAYGTLVRVIASPQAHYDFLGWSGDTTATRDTLALVVRRDWALTATFADTTAPTVQVTSPAAGDTVLYPLATTFQWSADDANGVARVDLLLSRAGMSGPFDTLAANVPNTGSYAWFVAPPSSDDAMLAVVAHDDAGNEHTSYAGPFSIVDQQVPTLVVTFTAEARGADIVLHWQLFDPTLVASTIIERATERDGPWIHVNGEPHDQDGMRSLTDSGVESGASYWYRLVLLTPEGPTPIDGPVLATAAYVVRAFAIDAVSPNPSRGAVRIEYGVPAEAPVTLTILDLQGRVVATLADGPHAAGRHERVWSGRTENGPASAGVYFARVSSRGDVRVRRFILAR